MNFWNRILTRKKPERPEISFGRYTDAYKSKEQYESWDESLKLYEEGQILPSVRKLTEYLKNKSSDNLILLSDSPEFKFMLYHGSKQIHCTLSSQLFKAESKIAHCKELSVGFLRKAVEYTYNLNYSRFALDGDYNLCLIFDSYFAESSPYKLFYGIRELALQSDKEDDILVSEFEHLEPLQNQHIKRLSPEILKAKISFFHKKLNELAEADILGSLNPKRFQGALTYVYLAAIYSLDYLIKPEGTLMELLSRIHIKYFEAAPENTDLKLSILETGFEEISELEDEDLEKELYDVISTFGITSPANQNTIAQFIEAEIQALTWYEENKHFKVCVAICNYITGYCLYNYAMPAPIKELFHLYYEVTEPEYFNSLGMGTNYWESSKKLVQLDEVKQQIQDIMDSYESSYPGLPKRVEFDEAELHLFLRDYLLFIKNINIH